MSTLIIEQTREEARHAYSLQSRADMDSIRMLDANFLCNAALEDVEFPLVFMVKHHAEKVAVSGNKLTIPIKFGLKAFSEEKKEDVILIACRLRVDYVLNEGYTPSAEEIGAFKRGNAIFNCWPYFREFVQNTVTRMNYPPITVPFLRLAPKLPASAKTIEQSGTQLEQKEGEPKLKKRPSRTVKT